MTKRQAVTKARVANHEAVRFLRMGKPSVASYMVRLRNCWMREARSLK